MDKPCTLYNHYGWILFGTHWISVVEVVAVVVIVMVIVVLVVVVVFTAIWRQPAVACSVYAAAAGQGRADRIGVLVDCLRS